MSRLPLTRFDVTLGLGEPATCPTCGGAGGDPEALVLTATGYAPDAACPTCSGEGVIEGEPEEEPRIARLGTLTHPDGRVEELVGRADVAPLPAPVAGVIDLEPADVRRARDLRDLAEIQRKRGWRS